MKKPIHTITNVKDLIINVQNGKINPNPIGQRPAVSEGWGKSRNIIKTLIEDQDLGRITLRDIRKDTQARKVYPNTEYLVIDGGHRMRSIVDFEMNEFDVDGLRYIDLPDDIKKIFNEIEVQVSKFVCSDIQATQKFRNINTVTPVNHIEMIMSNDTSPFSKEIRSRVKPYKEYGNTNHPLFDVLSRNGKPPSPEHWATDANPRRKWDHFVSSIMLKSIGGGNVTAGLETVEKLVEDNYEISKTNLKTVDNFLDDTLKVSEDFKRKLNTDIFSAFQVVWFALFEKNKKFKITDHQSFGKQFFKAHSTLTGIKKNKYDSETREFEMSENNKEHKIVKEFARRSIKNLANEYQQREVAKLYLELMNIDNSVVFREVQRTVGKDNKFDMLASQDFKCAVDGLPLDIDDAIFGHDIAHKHGGKIKDGAIIRNEHNSDMGTTTLDEYKTILELRAGTLKVIPTVV